MCLATYEKQRTVPISNSCTKCVGMPGIKHDRTPGCHPVSRTTSQLIAALIRKLAYFFDMFSIGVCKTRYCKTYGRLLQELDVCTVMPKHSYPSFRNNEKQMQVFSHISIQRPLTAITFFQRGSRYPLDFFFFLKSHLHCLESWQFQLLGFTHFKSMRSLFASVALFISCVFSLYRTDTFNLLSSCLYSRHLVMC